MQGRQGDDKTGATVGLVVAFGLVGFMKHGKQAEVKEGTPLQLEGSVAVSNFTDAARTETLQSVGIWVEHLRTGEV